MIQKIDPEIASVVQNDSMQLKFAPFYGLYPDEFSTVLKISKNPLKSKLWPFLSNQIYHT